MRKCNKCGKSSDNFQKGRGTCRDCRNTQGKGWRRARKDVKAHNYGKETLPDGYKLKGVSQMLDAEGNVKVQWVKSESDKAAQSALLMQALENMARGFEGVVPRLKVSKRQKAKDLLTIIPLGDPHIGMHSWGKETGQDFDLEIAAHNMHTASADLLANAPDTENCLIINAGDYFHADSSANTTTKGTPVDMDGRRIKVVQVGLEIFVDLIQRCLAKYKHVTVICATGNHDADSSKMLSLMLSLMFNKEPRVLINVEPTKHHKFRFGKCLFGITHGDTGKAAELPILMATDWKTDWAETDYRYWYTGHVHHKTVTEYTGGVIVETLRTLAPSDSWHRGQGYRSGQDLILDVWDAEYGHIQRNTVGIKRVHELQRKGEMI